MIMARIPQISHWMDEDIETLPREKLIEIINQLGAELDETRQSAIRLNRTWAGIAKSIARRCR